MSQIKLISFLFLALHLSESLQILLVNLSNAAFSQQNIIYRAFLETVLTEGSLDSFDLSPKASLKALKYLLQKTV